MIYPRPLRLRVFVNLQNRAVNINKNLPIKKPATTDEKIAVYTTEKPDKSKATNQHGDCGNAQITSPAKLVLKERKAL